MGNLNIQPLNPLSPFIEDRETFEGYTIDADGTSLMDDGFNIIPHEDGYEVQFFISDISVYYELTQSIPRARGINSPKPDIGEKDERLKPMSFSLDETHATPAVGIFAQIDKDGNFLSVDVGRVMFANKHAYSESEIEKCLARQDPLVLAWREIALKIKAHANKDILMTSTQGFKLCETLSTFANYAMTVFCVEHDIPLLYQNRSAEASLTDEIGLKFYNKKDVIDALGTTTADGLYKYHHSFAPIPGLLEYSPVAKGNISKSYEPYARFSSPLRLFHDTVNLWNVTEFLETGRNVEFNFEDLEKIGKQQTRVYQDHIQNGNMIKAQKLEKEIVKSLQSPSKIKQLPSKQLFAILKHLFTLDNETVLSMAREIDPHKDDQSVLSEKFSQPPRPQTRPQNSSSRKRGNRFIKTKTAIPDIRLKPSFDQAARAPKPSRESVLTPFIQEACDRVVEEINIDFLLTATLGNPQRTDQEIRLAKLARKTILNDNYITATPEEILSVIMKRRLGIDEIYFTLHEHEHGKFAFQPFLRKGSKTFSVPVVSSMPRRQKSLKPFLELAQRKLLESLLNNTLTLPYKSEFDWNKQTSAQSWAPAQPKMGSRKTNRRSPRPHKQKSFKK